VILSRVLTDEEFPIVFAETHAVIEEAKAAGVYVFGGGIEEDVDPVLVSADGSVSTETYPGSELKGGFTVLELHARGRGRVGEEDRGGLPLLAGAPRVRVRPGQLACDRPSRMVHRRRVELDPEPPDSRTTAATVSRESLSMAIEAKNRLPASRTFSGASEVSGKRIGNRTR
jgi:hypothetical protein